MQAVDYTASDGRRWRVMCPEHDLEHPERGIIVGPPDISGLNLPFDVMVRLHNQLHARELFTLADFNRRRLDAIGALQAALTLDVERIAAEYTRQMPEQPQPQSRGTVAGDDTDDVVQIATSQGVRVARRRPVDTDTNNQTSGQEL